MAEAARKRAVIELSDSEEDCCEPSNPIVGEKRVRRDNSLLSVGLHLSHLRNIDNAYNVNCRTLASLLSLEPSVSQLYIFTFVIDIEYMFRMLPAKHRNVPITIVHGHKREEQSEAYLRLKLFADTHKNVRLVEPYTPPWGTHHTKMIVYENLSDELRLVIHTGNATPYDWDYGNMTQGCWISPAIPRKGRENDSESEFEVEMCRYLDAYGWRLQGLKKLVKAHDFSRVRAKLVSSVPGRHAGEKLDWFGHMRLRKLLQDYKPNGDPGSLVISQCSSLGNLGPNQRWLNDFTTSLTTTESGVTPADLRLIYPCEEDVAAALQPELAAGHLLCNANAWTKMESTLRGAMCRWSAESSGRTQCMPHHKSYARLDPNSKMVDWYLLTSANMSKAAWGDLQKGNSELKILSYELGVLFCNPIKDGGDRRLSLERFSPKELSEANIVYARGPRHPECDAALLPIPYDLPLVPYRESDYPWSANSFQKYEHLFGADV